MAGQLVGYRRTSSLEQQNGFVAQEEALLSAGAVRIFAEQVSSVAKRDQLTAALDYVREGDTLIVTRLDRLARSTADLLAIVDTLERKQVALLILDFAGGVLDSKSPTGKMLLVMLSAVAEFERAIMLDRQRVGVARARAEGKYRGRAPTARRVAPQVRELRATGMGARAIAAKLNISRASVYRLWDEAAGQ